MLFSEVLERFQCELFMKQTVPPRVAKKEESGFFRIIEIDDSDSFCRRLFPIAGLCAGIGKVCPIGLEMTRCISHITL